MLRKYNRKAEDFSSAFLLKQITAVVKLDGISLLYLIGRGAVAWLYAVYLVEPAGVFAAVKLIKVMYSLDVGGVICRCFGKFKMDFTAIF